MAIRLAKTLIRCPDSEISPIRPIHELSGLPRLGHFQGIDDFIGV